jgi:hypothetical protein
MARREELRTIFCRRQEGCEEFIVVWIKESCSFSRRRRVAEAQAARLAFSRPSGALGKRNFGTTRPNEILFCGFNFYTQNGALRYCDVFTLEGSPCMSEGWYDLHPQPRCLQTGFLIVGSLFISTLVFSELIPVHRNSLRNYLSLSLKSTHQTSVVNFPKYETTFHLDLQSTS